MEGAPKGQEQQNTTTQWDTLTNPVKVEKKEDQNWDPRLTEEQVDELWAEGITPKDAEYGPALYNYGLKPSDGEAEPEKPSWDPRLTQEQIDDMIQKGIYEPVGPEYHQALAEFGINDTPQDDDPNKKEPTPGEDPNKTPEPEKDPEKPGEKKPEDDEKKNKVDLDTGDKLRVVQEEIDKEKIKRKEELEEELKKLLPNIAELYARNRRLIVGAENKAKFNKVKGRYEELLDEYLRIKAETTYEQGRDAANKEITKRVEELNKEIHDKLIEFVGGDPENTDKTQKEVDDERARLMREAAGKLNAEYRDMMTGVEAKVNAEFLSDFIKQRNDLEDATIDALDNGTMCRKFISKVLTNKHLKRALLVAGAVGLAATGIGLATGAITLGFGLTASGMAAGAAKGALSGILMSRQSSKNSAVRGFASEEEIIKRLQNVNVLDRNSDTGNVASYILEQYSEANSADAKSNKKRTAISAGIGAVIGAVMSGVKINSAVKGTETVEQPGDTTPVEYKAANIDNVDIARGHGAYDTFTQMAGDPSKYKEAEQIMYKVAEGYIEKQADGSIKHLFVPGSNGIVEGLGGEVGKYAFTYEGPISQWPDVARSMIEETASKWAEAGLVPAIKTGGEQVMNTVTRAVTNYIPNAFMTLLARGTGLVVGTGLAGRAIGERPNRINTAENSPEEPEEGTESGGEGETPVEGETPAPNNPETPDEKREAFKAEIEQAFGDSIGENGSTIMSNNEALGFTQLEAIRNWWQSLSDDTRQRVSDFMATSDPSNGQTLRIWLSITQPK